MNALPGVAPSNHQASNAAPGPASAEKIPDSVLQHPIIGEVRRFDGATAPANWMLAQGQTMNVAENPRLFSILGPRNGGSTFRLPRSKYGWIIAVAGSYPTSPGFVEQLGRGTAPPGALASTGIARRRVQRVRTDPRAAEVRNGTSFMRAARAEPVSGQAYERMRAVRREARDAAFAALGANSRSRAEAAVASVVAGSVVVHEATLQLARALSGAEAQALLAVSDGMTRSTSNSPPVEDHREPQFEASRFLFSVAVTRDEMRAVLRAQQRSMR